jgi:hypothetical protein
MILNSWPTNSEVSSLKNCGYKPSASSCQKTTVYYSLKEHLSVLWNLLQTIWLWILLLLVWHFHHNLNKIRNINMRSEVVTVMSIKSMVLYNVMPCIPTLQRNFLPPLTIYVTPFPTQFTLLSWRWRQQSPPKCWHLSTTLQRITSYTIICTIIKNVQFKCIPLHVFIKLTTTVQHLPRKKILLVVQ